MNFEKINSETATETENKEAQKMAEQIASGLIEGNLLLPQTYEAIAVCGAKAIVEQGKHVQSLDIVYDAMREEHVRITQRLADVMITAHQARGIDYTSERFADEEQFAKHMQGVISTHVRFAKTAVEEVFEHTNDLDAKEQPFDTAFRVLELLHTSLKDESLRPLIKEYISAAAQKRAGGREQLREVKVKWKNLFLSRAAEAGLVKADLSRLFDRVALPLG